MVKGVIDYYTPYDQLQSALTKLDSVATKLDTVAGKLDTVCTKLDSVASKLDTTIARLDTTITKLDTQITKLTSIVAATEGRKFAGYIKLTTTCIQIVDAIGAAALNIICWSHPENTANITIYAGADCTGELLATIGPGGVFCRAATSGDFSAKAASGTQYLGLMVT